MWFSAAPNSTSPDVVALTVKSVSTTLANLQPATTTSSVLTQNSGDKLKGDRHVTPSDLKVTDVSRNTLKLSWSAPEGAFDGFTVELKSMSNKSIQNIIEVFGEAREVQIDDLTPDVRYDITLYGVVEGEKSQPVSVQVKTGTSVSTSRVVCHLP